MFDAPPEEKQRLEWDISLPLEDRPWQVGLIYGPSGSGKSTVARALFGGETKVEWRAKTALIDNFPAAMSVEQIATLCSAVGLNTIPCWLRPHEVLSNGEKFRADMARLLAEAAPGSTVVVDEFTSVVDRQVAQVASHALQKAVRKAGFRLVAVSCHSDIIEWLQPDWTLDMGASGKFDWGSLRRRPPIQCTIARVDRAAWARFSRYHYLTAELANAAQCFGLWAGDQLAAFAGLMYRPHPSADNILGVSRLVTLPDYQGLGLAFVLVDTIGALLTRLGWRLRTYPAHPSLLRAFDRSPKWALKEKPRMKSVAGSLGFGGRPNAVFEYVGPVHEDVVLAKEVTRYPDRNRANRGKIGARNSAG